MEQQYTEHDMRNACEEYARTGQLRATARNWAIPPSTLRIRLNGALPRSVAFQDYQRLSVVQETHLADWIRVQQTLGVPPTHAQIREMASRVCKERGDDRRLSIKWMEGFLKRHPFLRTQRARVVDANRINSATEAIIRPWFSLFQIPEVKAILPENRWNKDEAGIMEGLGENGLVVGTADHKALQKKQPGGRTWTSFIECISATGRFLPPLVIFRGKTVQQQWFPTDLQPFKHWKFTATPKGWTDNETSLKWLKNVFIPLTKPASPDQKRLLVIDGHGSHVTAEYMYKAYVNNIYLIYLPAHTSHVLQPLDLSIFSPLKRAYRNRLDRLLSMAIDDTSVVSKRAFLECYYQARSVAFTEANIKVGWQATGLWPLFITKPLMSRLLLKNANSISTPKPRKAVTKAAAEVRAFETPILDSCGEKPEVWLTPRKAKDWSEQARKFATTIKATSTDRLFLRKAGKALDEKAFELAACKRKIQALEQEVERLRRTKKKKVEEDPNTLFASIRTISDAQRLVGRQAVKEEDSSEEEDSSDAESCIEVL